MGLLQIFTLLGALGMFLYGMNLMSSGLQKAAGDRLRSFLSAMTSAHSKELEKMGDFIINISQDLHKCMSKVS